MAHVSQIITSSGHYNDNYAEGGDGGIKNNLETAFGGGDSGGMSDRITRLEAHFEYVRRDLDGIKATNEKILDALGDVKLSLKDLPSKADLTAWKWQWTGISIALVALIVGCIIGGLDWIKPH